MKKAHHSSSRHTRLIVVILFGLLVIAGVWAYNANLEYIHDTADRASNTRVVTETVSTDAWATWRTYQNSTYKFSIKYPREWAAAGVYSNTGGYYLVTFGKSGAPATTLKIYGAGKSGELAQKSGIQDVTIGGVSGQMYVGQTEAGKAHVIIGFKRNGYTYELSSTEAVTTVMEMAKTIKFQ